MIFDDASKELNNVLTTGVKFICNNHIDQFPTLSLYEYCMDTRPCRVIVTDCKVGRYILFCLIEIYKFCRDNDVTLIKVICLGK